MLFLSFRNGACGQGDGILEVKLNFKGGLLSCIFLQDATICQKIHICLQTGNLLSDFQIPLTHLILKLKSIVIPPHKMSRNEEKNAQVENLIWCILTALRRNLKSPNLLKDPVCKVGVGSVNKKGRETQDFQLSCYFSC